MGEGIKMRCKSLVFGRYVGFPRNRPDGSLPKEAVYGWAIPLPIGLLSISLV